MIAQRLDQQQGDAADGLETVVRRCLGSRVRGFRLVILGEGLVLLGQTETFYAKQLAQHVVMEATRKKILANDIEVTSE